ncbi:MAG: PIN domain-containing protein [Anaerolineae bacterium]|nr:PIN domain-containing protein [Bacillota bacterium]MDI7277856.1 PIN domain-containing protein [Anaerolineae bacterium]
MPDAIKADPADSHVLACALSANADFLVSGDKHLLNLGSYGPMITCTAARFLQSHYTSATSPTN